MPKTTSILTNNAHSILKMLELMKQPNGTTIEEICNELQITRRSVFRFLKTIEQKFCIPITIHRISYSGSASYHLSPAFIESLSEISLPELRFTFTQATFFYLAIKDDSFPTHSSVSQEINQLRKWLKINYNL